MKEKIKIIIILFCIFLSVPAISLAISEEELYIERVAERIEIDLEILEKLDKAVEEDDLEEFFLILSDKYSKFQESHNIYKNRPENLSEEVVKLVNKLEEGSRDIARGSDLLFSLSEDFSEQEFMQGWNLIISGLEKYAEAQEMAEELDKEYNSTRNIYLFGVIIGIGGFLLFFFLSLKKPVAVGLKLVRNGFGFIGLGFGITLAGYLWMSGGTYYILWGLPIYGGYLILKGISVYFEKEDKMEETQEIYGNKN